MGNNNGQTNFLIAGAALIGFLVGLFVFGWGLTPPKFSNAGPEHLEARHLDEYVTGLASYYAASSDPNYLRHALCYDDDLDAVRSQVQFVEDGIVRSNYDTVIRVIDADGGCDTYRANNAPEAEPTSGLISRLCLWGLVLAGIVGFLFFLLRQRGAGADNDDGQGTVRRFAPRQEPEPVEEPRTRVREQRRERPIEAAAPLPPKPPQPPVERQQRVERRAKPAPRRPAPAGDPTPLAGFQTTYLRGDDNFDKSFIIENANGDFLGECGVSISESIGQGPMRNVTAFEIWLFDKNDTHTVTKVIMSEHAYNDEGFRAKLATRGEPMLAQFDETIALETNSLIINAEVTEIEYSDENPDRSTFERFTVELSAWVKANNAPSNGGGVDGLLDM